MKSNFFVIALISISLIILINIAITAFIHSNTIEHKILKINHDQCSNIKNNDRFDCLPESKKTQQLCEERGCCWISSTKKCNTSNNKYRKFTSPQCFYPNDYGGYKIINTIEKEFGLEVYLDRTFQSPYPNDAPTISFVVKFETDNRLRVQILDPFNDRYQALYPKVPLVNEKSKNPNYSFEINKSQTGFKVIRNSDNQIIFNAQNIGALIFADQFLQISARLPENINIYGLGEHRTSFPLGWDWQTLTMFNYDHYPAENMNLYGSQPFYLAVEQNGMSHGVVLLNTNAMEVILQPAPGITFRTLGGILDFYFLLGPTPQDVVSQYTEIVGRPFMPPYWSLGFHLCRYGINTLNRTKEILERNIKAGIPIEVQWSDIDYMILNDDFTYDEERFKDLPEFINDLHKRGMRWIPIIDPGISSGEKNNTYLPFDKGIEMDIFVKNSTDQVLYGLVWNEFGTVFPDFTNPATQYYWTEILETFHSIVAFDGIWLDMNEPSNYVKGSLYGCPNSSIENPPYVPFVNGDNTLASKTLCMTAKHHAGIHYDLHNIYGLSETIMTNVSLTKILNKRPFILSRSSFLGQGHYTALWNGDCFSTWHDMKSSITEMLTNSIFGISMFGADICGFIGDTNAELCARWTQLGAFYPFSRNHNNKNAIDQDPVALGKWTINSAKRSLSLRYLLLPLLYTLLWKSHTSSSTVATPLFFQYPNDPNTFIIDDQFLWGSSIMIIPVLHWDTTNVSAYLPKDTWYDFYTGETIIGKRNRVTLDAPIDTIPLLVRGGSVIPMQTPDITTTLTRVNPIKLLVALNSNGYAFGELYWDDGDSLSDYKSTYSLIKMELKNNTLNCTPIKNNYKIIPPLNGVTVFGIKKVKSVFVNNKSIAFEYENNVLEISEINQSLLFAIGITWEYATNSQISIYFNYNLCLCIILINILY